MHFFRYLRRSFDSRIQKNHRKIVSNILNRSPKGFDTNRRVSAGIAILAYFSAKIFFALNKLIFHKNVI